MDLHKRITKNTYSSHFLDVMNYVTKGLMGEYICYSRFTVSCPDRTLHNAQ